MLGISNRIVSFTNFYNQLKILVVAVSPFVKRAPVIYFTKELTTTTKFYPAHHSLI
jgi:hypothetical protein